MAIAPALGARAQLERTAAALGWPALGEQPLHIAASEARWLTEQSDRTYPPFITVTQDVEITFAPATLVERRAAFGGRQVSLSTASGTFAVRGDSVSPAPVLHWNAQFERALNPWAVVGDWRRSTDQLTVERCLFRDHARVALRRTGPDGTERLLLHHDTGMPLGLFRTEPHYLWGAADVLYIWATWWLTDGVRYPVSSTLVIEGFETVTRTVYPGRVRRISADSIRLRAPAERVIAQPPQFLRQDRPDTVRVDDSTYVLSNPGYNEAIALVADTVFVFDATQGPERARHDAAWVDTIFGPSHPVVVVVSDVAWPHIAGLVDWVSRGAQVVVHHTNVPFLRRLLSRHPQSATASWNLHPVTDVERRAGGRVLIVPVDGPSTEGALVAYLPAARFLWAGDYVQTVAEPSGYAHEVRAATTRAGLVPHYVAAQHLHLTPWSVVERLFNGRP